MSAGAKSLFAWEPFTPRGVAAFARAGTGRLLFAQAVVALLVAASVAVFLENSIFPVLGAAISRLPASGEIRSAQLDWRGASPVMMLAEGRCLALGVDLEHGGGINYVADLQIEFGRQTVRASSLLGYTELPYPGGFVIAFNSTELEPLWGAWRAVLLFLAAIATMIMLVAGWWLLAALYVLPVALASVFLNRDLNFRRSWKLSCAALLPGGLLMAADILFYNFGAVGLVQFGFIFAAHIVLGWIYIFVSLLFVPGIAVTPSRANPFAAKK